MLVRLDVAEYQKKVGICGCFTGRLAFLVNLLLFLNSFLVFYYIAGDPFSLFGIGLITYWFLLILISCFFNSDQFLIFMILWWICSSPTLEFIAISYLSYHISQIYLRFLIKFVFFDIWVKRFLFLLKFSQLMFQKFPFWEFLVH